MGRWCNYHKGQSALRIYANQPTFNQEKALVGAFSVIVKPDGSFAALELSLTNDECRRVILIAAITPPASSQGGYSYKHSQVCSELCIIPLFSENIHPC